jgi:parallel beta-helix repeat protein
MPAAIDTDNTIENNEIVGNANGIFVTTGVQGNIFRGNTIVGNPPVQIAVDHTANEGFDIKNLADAGANAFEGNICRTSINAPCPSVGPSMTANPNPITVAGNAIVGSTTISWNAPDAQVIEIHIGSPDGTLLTQQLNRGAIQTGTWVSDGLTFYLQDVTGGKPLTSDYTLATLVVHFAKEWQRVSRFPGRTALVGRRYGGPVRTLSVLCAAGAVRSSMESPLRGSASRGPVRRNRVQLVAIRCGPNSTCAATDGRHTGPNDRRPQKPAGARPIRVRHAGLQELPHHRPRWEAWFHRERQGTGAGLRRMH